MAGLIQYSNTAGNTPASLGNADLGINQADGKLFYRNASGVVTQFSAASTNIVEVATTASLPTTGASSTLYIASDYGRVYRWAGSSIKYVEVGSLGGDGSLWSNLVPSAPNSLSGAIANGQVTLTWTAPTYSAAAITDYSIQYSTNSGSSWTNWSHTASTATTAVVTGLTNGTSYLFRVAAINGIGTGTFSTTGALVPNGDAYFANVVALMHFDGTNGSTTFTDSSGTPKTFTGSGSPAISITQSKFGGASLQITSGKYVTSTSASYAMAGSNCVIEGWYYPTTLTDGDRIFMIEAASSDTRGLIWYQSTLQYFQIASGTLVAGTAITANQWYYIAVVQSGTTARLYLNGSLVTSTTATLIPTSANRVTFGASVNSGILSQANGYYDDWRITSGTDRGYTGSTIAVPSAAFLNS